MDHRFGDVSLELALKSPLGHFVEIYYLPVHIWTQSGEYTEWGNPQHVRRLTDVGAGVSLAPNSPVRAGPLAGDQAAVDLRKDGSDGSR